MAKKGKKRARADANVNDHRTASLPSKSHHSVSLPRAFPSGLPVPSGSFLRDEPPYRDSFQAALDTSYEGFAVDDASTCDADAALFPHESIQTALHVMEQAGLFRTDVTQPFGLGTKCAKTYVTRCLVGEAGTTYRYLGLRMFAHPWGCSRQRGSPDKRNQSTSRDEMSLETAVGTIQELNEILAERTRHHLGDLDQKRNDRGATPTRGRAAFDIALINRMENYRELKVEPTIGEGRCSVSWHADSSLEHFSSIGVYHILQKTKQKNSEPGGWSVALRVAHHSEGPSASHRGTSVESSIVAQTPPIAVSLPSGSAYYLLDDFNHHHQHAVLASGENAGVRYSSTHRLLRESHNVKFLLGRCKSVCSNFHKRGPKIWRSEQLLLTELESEWIRQFYIQGKQHQDLLWKAWGNWIRQLLQHWSTLEHRTRQIVDLLQSAAEGRCDVDAVDATASPPPRQQRKAREKRKKATAVVRELLSRSAESTHGNQEHDGATARRNIYEPLADLLEERATMREFWTKREEDGVFGDLDPANRPMPVPFKFVGERIQVSHGSDCAVSSLPGLPGELRNIASSLRSWGEAFDTGNKTDFPSISISSALPVEHTSDNGSNGQINNSNESDHDKQLEWLGWSQASIGLEMQSPWAELLLAGKKKVETRTYDLPPGLLGRRIDILQSRKGTPGVSSIGNVVAIDSSNGEDPPVRPVGWCVFKRTLKYPDRVSFEADKDVHLVTRESGFGWKDDSAKTLYGWAVGEAGMYTAGSKAGCLKTIVRRKRSLFELVKDSGPCNAGAVDGL